MIYGGFLHAKAQRLNSRWEESNHFSPEHGRIMKRSGLSILIGLMLCLSMTTSISAQPRTFQQLVDAYFDDYFKENPSQATSVGFHQYDHQLEDFSLPAHQRPP